MIELTKISPGILLLLGGLISPLFPRKLQKYITVVLPALAIIHIFILFGESGKGLSQTINFISLKLLLIQENNFSFLFGLFFAISALFINLFMFSSEVRLPSTLALISSGAAVSLSFAGDLFLALIFLEIISFASLIIIWNSCSDKARNAGIRYMVIQVFAGLLIASGLIHRVFMTGDYGITKLGLGGEFILDNLGIYLIFAGLLIKAAAFPMSAWVPDSYGEANPNGALILTAFLTKAALSLIILIFGGEGALIYIGILMAFYGLFYACFENKIVKMLCYSYVAQLGVAIVAVGIGGQGLISAAIMASSFYFIVLFMVYSLVNHTTSARYFSEVPGFLIIKMPHIALITLIASVSMAGFPFTIGFLAKIITMNSEVVTSNHLLYITLLALAASVVLHAGLRYPYMLFFSKNKDRDIRTIPKTMDISLYGVATIMVILGLVPQLVFLFTPHVENINSVVTRFYSFAEITKQAMLLAFAAFAFYILSPFMNSKNTVTLDFDWFYRILIKNLILLVYKLSEYLWGIFICFIMLLKNKLFFAIDYSFSSSRGWQNSAFTIGKTMLYLTMVLTIILVLYYIK